MRTPRPTARAKVRGELVHVGDMPVGRCLHAAVHRSTRPHATIVAVDTTAARSLPGVVAVVTGADLVNVAYHELAPVPDVAAALAGGSFVREALRPSMVFGDLRHLSGRTGTNVNYEYALRHGDAAAARAPAATTATGQFWCPPTHHVPIELFCTFASPDGDRLELLTTTQTPVVRPADPRRPAGPAAEPGPGFGPRRWAAASARRYTTGWSHWSARWPGPSAGR